MASDRMHALYDRASDAEAGYDWITVCDEAIKDYHCELTLPITPEANKMACMPSISFSVDYNVPGAEKLTIYRTANGYIVKRCDETSHLESRVFASLPQVFKHLSASFEPKKAKKRSRKAHKKARR